MQDKEIHQLLEELQKITTGISTFFNTQKEVLSTLLELEHRIDLMLKDVEKHNKVLNGSKESLPIRILLLESKIQELEKDFLDTKEDDIRLKDKSDANFYKVLSVFIGGIFTISASIIAYYLGLAK